MLNDMKFPTPVWFMNPLTGHIYEAFLIKESTILGDDRVVIYIPAQDRAAYAVKEHLYDDEKTARERIKRAELERKIKEGREAIKDAMTKLGQLENELASLLGR
jgi:hypothetical protein